MTLLSEVDSIYRYISTKIKREDVSEIVIDNTYNSTLQDFIDDGLVSLPPDGLGVVPAGTRRLSESGSGCAIILFPEFRDLGSNERKTTLAHEVYHCFQHSLLENDPEKIDSLPKWLYEGTAAWVGETYSGGSQLIENWWEDYFFKNIPLFDRWYDAIGFFAHLRDSESEEYVWSILDDMLLNPEQAFEIAISRSGNRNRILQRWPTRTYRDEGEWNFSPDTPGLPDITKDPTVELSVSGTSTWSLDLATPDLAFVTLTPGEITEVSLEGFGAIRPLEDSSVPEYSFAGGDSKKYCLGDQECRCTDGSIPEGVEIISRGDLIVAITGDQEPASVQIQAVSKDCSVMSTGDECEVIVGDSYQLTRVQENGYRIQYLGRDGLIDSLIIGGTSYAGFNPYFEEEDIQEQMTRCQSIQQRSDSDRDCSRNAILLEGLEKCGDTCQVVSYGERLSRLWQRTDLMESFPSVPSMTDAFQVFEGFRSFATSIGSEAINGDQTTIYEIDLTSVYGDIVLEDDFSGGFIGSGVVRYWVDNNDILRRMAWNNSDGTTYQVTCSYDQSFPLITAPF